MSRLKIRFTSGETAIVDGLQAGQLQAINRMASTTLVQGRIGNTEVWINPEHVEFVEVRPEPEDPPGR